MEYYDKQALLITHFVISAALTALTGVDGEMFSLEALLFDNNFELKGIVSHCQSTHTPNLTLPYITNIHFNLDGIFEWRNRCFSFRQK